MMDITINNSKFNIVVNKESDNVFYVKAYNGNKNELGFVNFKIIRESFFKKIWIYLIQTHSEYAHKGVGTALLYVMEYIASTYNIKYIEGKFYPKNYHAKPFYEKHGYEIYKDDYDWFVDKSLDLNKINAEVKPLISNYEIIYEHKEME